MGRNHSTFSFVTGLGKHTASSFGKDLGLDTFQKTIVNSMLENGGKLNADHFNSAHQLLGKLELGMRTINIIGKLTTELMVSNPLDELEQKLSSHFLVYFGKLLPLNYSYLGWLVIKLRPIRKQTALTYGLNSDSIKSEILMETRIFVSLIQFLNYAQHLDFEIKDLGSTAYRKVVVKLRDLFQFQDPSFKPTNKIREKI